MIRKIKNIIPSPVFNKIKKSYYDIKLKKAKAAFKEAGFKPAFLPFTSLETLHNKYRINTDVSYESEALLERANDRVEEIKNLVGKDFQNIKTALEIGCGDGMVCSVLSSDHKIKSCGMDIDDEMFDARAKKNDVEFITGDAKNINKPDNHYDLIFSYNSFEHIVDPEGVLLEALRLLKPGGFMFLSFNPQYCAAYGFHAYKSVAIPYVHFLFQLKDLKTYIANKKLADISYSENNLNKWSLSAYRSLWNKHADKYEFINYIEMPDYNGINLIHSYPSCFKSKSVVFDDFIYSGIRIVIRKSHELKAVCSYLLFNLINTIFSYNVEFVMA